MAITGLYKIFDHWHKEGSVYIYSDPHFNDLELNKNINRPNADEMVKIINSKCGRKDTLIILGDICDIEPVRKLRAKRKILIMGNHDAGKTNYERKKWNKKFDQSVYSQESLLQLIKELYPNCKYAIESGHQLHSPFNYWEVEIDNMLFDEVYEGPLMISEKLILSHEPVNVPWAFNIHGHIHDIRHKNDKNHFNVCSDVIDYTPINFNQWMKQGYLSKIITIHRDTINLATKKSKSKSKNKQKK